MALNPADIATVSRLLDEGLELPDADREAWLHALPADQQHHAATLRGMLARQAQLDTAGPLGSMPDLRTDEAVAHAGDVVGPYRLLREIGRGGMGSVWLAERADGSFRRQVALKLPRLAWGAGLAERMARERQIGALLEHPNIARLYDAGVDGRGRPYLALEYIAGQPIDAWCEAQGLSVRDRLHLFVQVARAVAYAHGRLVVHRDLKPSNVMVTPDGQVHLLDFGIAKLLDEARPGEPGITEVQGRVMTPLYASPEQVAGAAVTVQADVYSLGVLLYELLTGALPITPRRTTPGAVEDAILEGGAPPASSRAHDKSLARALRGEVDAILAKAMKREPAERYATADALAQDIERHLNGETVVARPDSTLYRLRKAMWRHRVAFGAAVAVLAAILGGSTVAVVQAQRANTESERARLVREFVVDIFDSNAGSDGSLAQIPAQALLDRSANQIEGKFAGQPLLQADLYGVTRQMYSNLANYQKAVEFGTKQVEALGAANAPGPQISSALIRLASDLTGLGRWKDAELRFHRAIILADEEGGLIVRAKSGMANALMFGVGNYADAGKELDEADALMARHPVPPADRANVLLIRGVWLADTGHIEQSWRAFDEAIQLALGAEGLLSRTAMDARTQVAARLIWFGRSEAAKPYLQAALAAMRAMGGPNDERAALEEARSDAYMFTDNGGVTFQETISAFEQLRNATKSRPWFATDTNRRWWDILLADVYRQWGDTARGYELMSSAKATIIADTDGTPSRRHYALFFMIHPAMWSGHVAESEQIAQEMLAISQATSMKGDGERDDRLLLAESMLHAGHIQKAAAVISDLDALPGVKVDMEKALAAGQAPEDIRLLLKLDLGEMQSVVALTERMKSRSGVHDDESAWLARATALCALGRSGEALGLFNTWLPRLATDRWEANPKLAFWRARMGLCALRSGQGQQARDASVLADAALAKQPAVSEHFKAPILELRRRLRST
jgi:serine/threonine protein kinase